MTRYMRRRNVSQVFYEKLVIIIVLLFLLSTCSTVPTTNEVEPSRFSGDHTTIQIRGLWYVCLQARQRGLPNLPPPVHTAHCDCVLDKSREQFSSKDYDIMTQDNLLRAFMSINMDCGMLNNLEPAKTNPASI
jgi:hypothetical protein